MQTVLVVSVWIHIVAAMVWVGGMTFLTLALVPVLRRPEYREQAAAMIQLTGRRFRVVSWISFLVLALTGIVNIVARGWVEAGAGFWQSGQGQALTWKIALFLLVLILSLYHDFAVGADAVRKMQDDPQSPAALKARRLATWMGRMNLGLGLAIIALAVLVVRGVP